MTSETHCDSSPLVSVIIIFLNGEKYIREAIDSVFSQTYPHWELLLADDGTTDSASAIAREYAGAHPDRVRYLEHEGHVNKGMSATRNLGIRSARGQLIAFLDCDDVWLPRKLERQTAMLQAHPEAAMVFGASEYWRSWSGAGEDVVAEVGVSPDTVFQPPDLLRLLYPLGEHSAPCPSDLMIRRDVFARTGGFQEEFRGIYSLFEDQAFLARVYVREPVLVSGECLTRYRLHEDSCMASVKGSGQYPAARLFFLRYLERYLTAGGVSDTDVWNLVRKAFRKLGHSVSIEGMQQIDVRELQWELRVAGGSEARLELPQDQPDLIRVNISKVVGSDPWDIQLNQPHLKVEQGQRYRLSFRARAERQRAVNVGFSKAHDPWDGLGLYQAVDLTGEWQEYGVEFSASAGDENARVHFDLGGKPISVELESVTLCTVPEGRVIRGDFTVQGEYPAERWLDALENHDAPGAEDGSQGPRFSVIIPTFQRRDLVLRAVRAFARQDFMAAFEVIVVVDGSLDGSAEALRALRVPFPLTVLEQPNGGAATARNQGASASGGRILLFLDDDMEPHPRLLAEHDRSHREGADVVLGHLPLHPKSPATFMSAGVKLWAEKRARQLSQPGADLSLHDLLTGQISVKREVFQKAAGFDTNFTRGGTFGNEDLDLGYRLMASGCRIVFNLYAISYQNYVITPRHYLRQIRETGQADVAFARKHPEQAGAIFALRPGRRLKPRTWRALAALSPLLAPLLNGLRSVALTLAEGPAPSPKAVNFYFEVCEMEYWRGVRQAGGMPYLQTVRVLAYHAIQDLAGDRLLESYGTPPREFRRQMKLLRYLGFHFVGADQFLQFWRLGTKLPVRPVLLTFDDCYQNLLEFGLPVLKEFGIPAIAFAVSSRLGMSNTWDETRGAQKLGLMDAGGLHLLEKHGVEIGAHTRAHRPLTELTPDEISDEVQGSIQELEAAGLRRPRTFAYPYGGWNGSARSAVKAAGLQAGFTIDAGVARRGGDPYLIPRIEIVRGDTGWRFLWKIIATA